MTAIPGQDEGVLSATLYLCHVMQRNGRLLTHARYVLFIDLPNTSRKEDSFCKCNSASIRSEDLYLYLYPVKHFHVHVGFLHVVEFIASGATCSCTLYALALRFTRIAFTPEWHAPKAPIAEAPYCRRQRHHRVKRRKPERPPYAMPYARRAAKTHIRLFALHQRCTTLPSVCSPNDSPSAMRVSLIALAPFSPRPQLRPGSSSEWCPRQGPFGAHAALGGRCPSLCQLGPLSRRRSEHDRASSLRPCGAPGAHGHRQLARREPQQHRQTR